MPKIFFTQKTRRDGLAGGSHMTDSAVQVVDLGLEKLSRWQFVCVPKILKREWRSRDCSLAVSAGVSGDFSFSLSLCLCFQWAHTPYGKNLKKEIRKMYSGSRFINICNFYCFIKDIKRNWPFPLYVCVCVSLCLCVGGAKEKKIQWLLVTVWYWSWFVLSCQQSYPLVFLHHSGNFSEKF